MVIKTKMVVTAPTIAKITRMRSMIVRMMSATMVRWILIPTNIP